MAAEPLTVALTLAKEIVEIIKQAFNSENRELMLKINEYKRIKKANNIAEDIFRITDPKFQSNKDYLKLRKKFDKKD